MHLNSGIPEFEIDIANTIDETSSTLLVIEIFFDHLTRLVNVEYENTAQLDNAYLQVMPFRILIALFLSGYLILAMLFNQKPAYSCFSQLSSLMHILWNNRRCCLSAVKLPLRPSEH